MQNGCTESSRQRFVPIQTNLLLYEACLHRPPLGSERPLPLMQHLVFAVRLVDTLHLVRHPM